MLHIILTILKILGIIIACIIGLLLLLILIVLFVPIRYKARGQIDKNHRGTLIISWMLHIVHIRITFQGKTQNTKIRVFGIPFDKFRFRKKSSDGFQSRKKNSEREELDKIQSESGNVDEDSGQDEYKPEQINTAKFQNSKPKLSIFERGKSFFQNIILKLKEIYNKLRLFFQNINNIKQRIINWYEYLTNEDNKKAIRFTKEQVFELLKHIKPKKIKLNMKIGTGDPATTGQLLGIISMFFNISPDGLEIEPDFEQQVFEGEYYIRGRIIVFNVLIIALKAYRNKELKAFIKNLPK